MIFEPRLFNRACGSHVFRVGSIYSGTSSARNRSVVTTAKIREFLRSSYIQWSGVVGSGLWFYRHCAWSVWSCDYMREPVLLHGCWSVSRECSVDLALGRARTQKSRLPEDLSPSLSLSLSYSFAMLACLDSDDVSDVRVLSHSWIVSGTRSNPLHCNKKNASANLSV